MNARFVLSKRKLLDQYKTIRNIADTVSYSVKTNPFPVHLLENTDAMFTVHSPNHIDMIKDKSRILFLANAWLTEDIDILIEKGVRSFIVDNETDLKIILDNPNYSSIDNLLLRMRLKEKTIHTERHFVYGMSSKQVNHLIPILRKDSRIKNLGIHFHRKTENISEWSLKEDLEILSSETISSIDIMDIGGGIPVKYKNYDVNLPYIFERIHILKKWLNENGVKLVVEPGRFISAPCIKLESQIKSLHENNITLNCSVYNAAMDTFATHTRLLVENELEAGDAYTIKGCTPDSLDIFRYRVFLDNPKVGDTITFLNAGAYNYATDFCGLKKLETVVVD